MSATSKTLVIPPEFTPIPTLNSDTFLGLADCIEQCIPDVDSTGPPTELTDDQKHQLIAAIFETVTAKFLNGEEFVYQDFVEEHAQSLTPPQARSFVVTALRQIASPEMSHVSVEPSWIFDEKAEAPPEEKAFEDLAHLSVLQYESVRKEVAKRLNVGRISVLDNAVAKKRKESESRASEHENTNRDFEEHKSKIESLLTKGRISYKNPASWEGGLTWNIKCVFDGAEADVRFGFNSQTVKYYDNYKCSSCEKDFKAFSEWVNHGKREDETHSKVTDLVKKFNNQFFVVENYGGKCRICWIDSDEKLGRYVLNQSFPDFHNRFQHLLIQTGTKTVGGNEIPVNKDHADVWLNHPERRQFTKIVFKPGESTPPDVYNLWQGFAYEPKQGDCSLYLAHLRDNVCRGNEEHYDWLAKWMAYHCQRPNEQGHSCVVVFGEKGVGKNIFAETFSKLWGAHGITVNDQKRVTGNFNNHLRDKTVLVADEAFFAGDPRQDRVLKSLVTSDTITIEAKGVDTIVVPNLWRVIILGNDRHLVRASYDERRYFVLECGGEQRNKQEYFAPLKQQLEQNGGAGYSALLYHLLNLDVGGFNVRKPPHTDALREQMSESTEGGKDVVREILTTRQIPGTVLNNGMVNLNLNDLVDWAIRKRPEWSRIKYNTLRDVLGKRGLGLETAKQVGEHGKGMRVWCLPTLKNCRRIWNEKFFPENWPNDGEEWESVGQSQGAKHV